MLLPVGLGLRADWKQLLPHLVLDIIIKERKARYNAEELKMAMRNDKGEEKSREERRSDAFRQAHLNSLHQISLELLPTYRF